MMKIAAELVGYAAVLTSFIMFQQTERKRLIGCKLIMDFLWIAHFLLIGGYTIVGTTAISVLREIVFIKKDKPFFKSRIWLFAFIVLYALTPIITWEGAHSIFPAISSVIATISLWMDSVNKTKKISFFVCVGQIIYAIARNSYAAISNEIITMSSIIISKIRRKRPMSITEEIEAKAQGIKEAVLSAESIAPEEGARVFYVANSGDDKNDGLSPETPIKTLERVNSLAIKGNTVKTYICFKRGDIFRGTLDAVDNTTYTAYGEGAKPILTASSENGAESNKWSLVEGTDNIWCFYRDMMDVGSIFFENGGYAVKLCPYIVNGKYEFGIESLENHQFINLLPEERAKELNNANCKEITGKLYLRCDEGNPGDVFSSVEFAERIYCVNLQYRCENIVIDNLHVDCVGAHGIGGGMINGLTVQNCEVSNIGGGIMLYRKSRAEDKYIVARYGNGIELHGACNGYIVQNCWVHDIYDAGITHQSGGNHGGDVSFDNVCYKGNLVERCIYSIEYYARRSTKNGEPMLMNNITIADNIIRYAGQGFGSQRTMMYNDWNMGTDIMGWFNSENVTNGKFVIENNILDHSIRSAPDRPIKESTSTLLISAEDEKYLPEMRGNIYVGLKGSQFCYFGKNVSPTPFVKAEAGLSAEELFGDKTGKIYIVDN